MQVPGSPASGVTFPLPRAWIPFFVLVVALLVTFGATFYVGSTNATRDQMRFQNAVEQTQTSIQTRLETYIAMLRAGSALFATNENLTLKQFRVYVERLEVQPRYPGIQGIGFSRRFGPAEKDDLIAAMRREVMPSFEITPTTPRPEYHAIIYLEPLDRRNQAALGYDMYSEPVRRAAMAQARDTGQPAASQRVQLVQEIDQQKQAGFLIYVPVYRGGHVPPTVAERRERLLGFVYSPFRADDLLRGIFGFERQPRLDFRVYDGAEIREEHLLHDSNTARRAGRENYTPRYLTSNTIEVAGHTWTIVYNSRAEFEQGSSRGLVPLIFFAGLGVSAILFAITHAQVRARMAAEELAHSLQLSENRFRRLVESNLFGVAFGDFDGSFFYANDAFLEMTGYTRADFEAGNVRWDEMTPPEFQHLDQHAAQELLTSGVATPFEKEYIRKDGSRIPILIGGALVNDPDQPQNQIAVFYLDLTERKQAEKAIHLLAEAGPALAASLDYDTLLKNLIRLAVPALADYCLILLVEADGVICEVTTTHKDPKRAEALLSFRQLLQQDLTTATSITADALQHGQPVFQPESRGTLVEIITGEPARLQVPARFVPRSLMVFPLQARDHTLGVWLLATETNGRRYSQVDLTLAAELARRVALALDNVRLYQEAQEAVRVRDHFLSIASHELKTPITSVQGYAEMLLRRATREGHASERDLRALRVIKDEASRLNKLVELLLDVSRIQTGRLLLQTGPVDLVALIQRLAEIVQPSLSQHELHLDLPNEPVVIEGDELRLEQVLQNLVNNAIKYSPQGGPIQVSLDRQAHHAIIAVTDQGIGIPPEGLSQLFGRFYRANNVGAHGISGLGLGLYIVNHIVTAHGGNIQVESEVGHGTTFQVVLPLNEPALALAR
jgi:PAS domain S-box-containing protein